MIPDDVLKLANWSEPREVRTKYGPKIVRNADPTDAFSAAWKANKEAVRALGASFSKDQRTGEWRLSWWQDIPPEEIARAKQAVEASRATDAAIEIPCPEGLAYLPFQRAGIAYALARPSVLIADEMGLGKSIETIGIINADPSLKKILLIVPASLKLNWKRECEKWLTRKMTIEIANGGDLPDADVVILNYDILKKYHAALMAIQWDARVMDEAHYCKNAKAQRTKLALAIKARRVIHLTGTPICNRPIELWTLLSDLDPATWNKKTFWSFARRYCNATQTRFGWDMTGAANLPELQTRLRETIMVRRLKADVLTELPPKTRQIIEVPANGLQSLVDEENEAWELRREKVELAELEARDAEETGDKASYEAAAEKLRDLARTAFEEMAEMRHRMGLAKVPAVIEHLETCLEDNDSKIVLFAWHKDVIAALMEGLAAFKPVKLTGDDSMEARQGAVDAFQTDPNIRVFVGNLQAAGVGITLTAASHVVFSELDWVPGNLTQAEDRCHRIGQAESVLVQHLVVDGSLDSRMVKVVVAKQNVIDRVLDRKVEMPVAPAFRATRPTGGAIEVTEGMYRTADGTIYKVQRALNSDHLYAKRLVPNQDGHGATFEFDRGAIATLKLTDRMTLEQAKEFGALYGYCCVCARRLTDEKSISAGIGPTCAGKFA